MRPLEGIRVVAIEQAVAAPFATSGLADVGAEVIKVERPEGDFVRLTRAGISLVDIVTGATAQSAILEALIQRDTTRQGTNISISMFDVMASWLTVPLLNHEGGKSPRRVGMAHPPISPLWCFQDKRGSSHSDLDPERLGVVDALRALSTATRAWLRSAICTNVARVTNRTETDGIVAGTFGEMSYDDAIEALGWADVAMASVNDMAVLATHPHLRRITVETPKALYPSPHPCRPGTKPCMPMARCPH